MLYVSKPALSTKVFVMTKYIGMPKWTRFWRLETMWIEQKEWRYFMEKCKCDCWNYKYINKGSLKNWRTRSCWCLNSEVRSIKGKNKTHGMSDEKIYRIFKSMKNRCEKTNVDCYYRYWWRWIKCLWMTFEDFLADMYESYLEHYKQYWAKNTSIERIDNNWHYCKENCKRSTAKEQAMNRRNNVKILFENKIYNPVDLANKLWISVNAIYISIRRNWLKVYGEKHNMQFQIL